jgi:hypothetical protein
MCTCSITFVSNGTQYIESSMTSSPNFRSTSTVISKKTFHINHKINSTHLSSSVLIYCSSKYKTKFSVNIQYDKFKFLQPNQTLKMSTLWLHAFCQTSLVKTVLHCPRTAAVSTAQQTSCCDTTQTYCKSTGRNLKVLSWATELVIQLVNLSPSTFLNNFHSCTPQHYWQNVKALDPDVNIFILLLQDTRSI